MTKPSAREFDFDRWRRPDCVAFVYPEWQEEVWLPIASINSCSGSDGFLVDGEARWLGDEELGRIRTTLRELGGSPQAQRMAPQLDHAIEMIEDSLKTGRGGVALVPPTPPEGE